MANIENLRRELEALLDDLAKRGTPSGEATAGVTGDAANEYSDALHKLSEYLTGRIDDAEEVLTTHPFVAIGAAFMLGVAVGRISRL